MLPNFRNPGKRLPRSVVRSDSPRLTVFRSPDGSVWTGSSRRSLADHLDENPLSAPPVKLAVKNLLPGSEVQPAVRDGDHHFPSHHLAFDVRITVVLAGLIVAIAGALRRQFFQKLVVVFEQPRLVVVDVHAGGDVHRIDQNQTLPHAAFLD